MRRKLVEEAIPDTLGKEVRKEASKLRGERIQSRLGHWKRGTFDEWPERDDIPGRRGGGGGRG